jgi:hypothetical protein
MIANNGNMKIAIVFLLILSISCKKNNGGNNKPTPSVTINSITQAEGNTGTSAFTFTVKLSSY